MLAPTWFLPHLAEQPLAVEAGATAAVVGAPFAGGRVSLGAPLGDRAQSTVAISGWSSSEALGSAGLAWRALDRERLDLGPFVALGGHLGPSVLDDRLAARAGVALDLRGERLALSASVPLVGGVWWRAPVHNRLGLMSPFETLVSTELQGSLALGRSQLGLGLLGPNLMASYGFQAERLGLQVAAGGSDQLQLALTRIVWSPR